MFLSKRDALEPAEGVLRHLAFHTQYLPPPTRYQFELPGGRFFQMQDFVLRGNRAIVCYALRPFVGGRVITAVIYRRRGQSQEGPWFVDWTDREHRRARSRMQNAIMSAWTGREIERDETAVVLDPLAEPKPVDATAIREKQAEGWFE